MIPNDLGLRELIEPLGSRAPVSRGQAAAALERSRASWRAFLAGHPAGYTYLRSCSEAPDRIENSFISVRDGRVLEHRCEEWGGPDPDAHGQSVAPEGTFKSVSAGYHHSCAIQADDSVTCWGAGTTSSNCENGEECGQADAPSGSFKELALGAKHSCGLTIADGLVCWGSDNFGRATPPQDFQ